MKGTRESLEQALAADFDDLTTHKVYADLLEEEGDPRGELIRVQLALEDKKLRAANRDSLKAREAELLAAHKKEWLGGLAPHLEYRRGPGGARPNCQFGVERGWVRSLSVLRLDKKPIKAVRGCPLIRMLSWVSLGGLSERGVSKPLLTAFRDAPFLATLQTVELGWNVDPLDWDEDDLAAVLGRMTRVEKLYLTVNGIGTGQLFRQRLPHLQELHLRGAASFALDVLAKNRSLGRLEDLTLEPPNPLPEDEPSPITLEGLRAVCRSPHLKGLKRLRLRRTDFGDDGVRELIDSGLIRRLDTLHLDGGAITDEGARLPAAVRELGKKEVSLRDNALSPEGVRLLTALGDSIFALDQHEPGSTDYLYEFDLE